MGSFASSQYRDCHGSFASFFFFLLGAFFLIDLKSVLLCVLCTMLSLILMLALVIV